MITVLRLRVRGKPTERYYFYFRIERRRFRGVTPCSTRKAAEEYARRRFEQELARLQGRAPSGTVPFGEFASDCLERLRPDVSPEWTRVQRYYLDTHFLPFFGAGTPLDSVRPEEIESYKAARREAGACAVTVNKELAVLSKLFKKAVQWGRLSVSPFWGVSRVRVDRNPEIRPLTAEEAGRLLLAAREEPFGPFIYVGLYSGMRPSEILGLRWRDVDFARGRIAVVHRADRPVKTGRDRSVAMHPELRDYLASLPRPMNVEAYLLPGEEGRRSRNVRHAFDRIVRLAGLHRVEPKVTPYTLRHTAATRLAERGASVAALREILGHTCLETTRRYLHLTPEDVTPAVARLDYLSKPCPNSPAAFAIAAGAEGTQPPAEKGGAEAGSRTPTPFRALDPESSASASSATPARMGGSLAISRVSVELAPPAFDSRWTRGGDSGYMAPPTSEV